MNNVYQNKKPYNPPNQELAPIFREPSEGKKEYLKEVAEAKKKYLCYTFNVEDEKGDPTNDERTICRPKGSGSLVFAWDSSKGNLLNDGVPKRK